MKMMVVTFAFHQDHITCNVWDKNEADDEDIWRINPSYSPRDMSE